MFSVAHVHHQLTSAVSLQVIKVAPRYCSLLLWPLAFLVGQCRFLCGPNRPRSRPSDGAGVQRRPY